MCVQMHGCTRARQASVQLRTKLLLLMPMLLVLLVLSGCLPRHGRNVQQHME